MVLSMLAWHSLFKLTIGSQSDYINFDKIYWFSTHHLTPITYDTLHLVDKLKLAGISAEQAEAVIRVIAEAQDQLLTKDDLKSTLDDLINPIKTDLAVLKWMIGILIASVMSLVIKTFFS